MRVILLSVLLCISFPTPSPATQELSLDSLLRANRYSLTIEDGQLGGPGAELIEDAAASAQFVGVLEVHNVGALADFTAALFARLHAAYGFRYAALEQGPVITRWLNETPRRGDLAAMAELVSRYPHAPTFATDEELAMMARIAATSDAEMTPVWGIDQEYGALHILEHLRTLAPSDEAREAVDRLLAGAERHERTRSGDTLYLAQVATPADFAALRDLFAEAGPDAVALVETLQLTNRIYHNWRRGAGYESSREREHSMKRLFMERYRAAQESGDHLPRVIAKMGHWHLFRGIYQANVTTFGNFLSEFAISNGMDSFLISTYVVDSPDGWRTIEGPLADAAGAGTFTLIDLRALRPLAHRGRIALGEGFERLVFQADAVLIVRGGRTGDYRIVRGEEIGD